MHASYERGAMAEIEVSGDRLMVYVTGVERTLALKSLSVLRWRRPRTRHRRQ